MKEKPDDVILDTIRELLIRDLDELLDDPAGAITSNVGLHEWVRRLKLVCAYLEQDWDALVKEWGSDYEIQRLQELLNDPNCGL